MGRPVNRPKQDPAGRWYVDCACGERVYATLPGGAEQAGNDLLTHIQVAANATGDPLTIPAGHTTRRDALLISSARDYFLGLRKAVAA